MTIVIYNFIVVFRNFMKFRYLHNWSYLHDWKARSTESLLDDNNTNSGRQTETMRQLLIFVEIIKIMEMTC